MSRERKRTSSTVVLTDTTDIGKAKDNMPPQATALYAVLLDLSSRLNSNELPEEKIMEILEERKEVFRSKQTPKRIYEYYRSLLIRQNLLVVR